MEIRFDNKVVVVTGGTTGIGYKIAEGFAREGASVAICARNEAGVESAIKEFKERGYSAYGESVDVSVRKRLFSFADRVEEKYGGIDIWVSNAAICPLKKVIDTPEELWDQVMAVNVKSVYFGGLIAADKIKKRGGGVLINGASFASLMPSVGYGVYSVSKGAVFNLTKSLAAELAPYNIRVAGYIPGIIVTRMTEKIIETKEKILQNQAAMNRLGQPEEVAEAVLYLASDKASYITGTFIEISGGKFCVQNPAAAWDS
jgi:NAD(P)-dependent dehydrogenase (short-subunit alcohol dehydrogenase family)